MGICLYGQLKQIGRFYMKGYKDTIDENAWKYEAMRTRIFYKTNTF